MHKFAGLCALREHQEVGQNPAASQYSVFIGQKMSLTG
jgi:hypothetical protein